jgi:hypothetical protein
MFFIFMLSVTASLSNTFHIFLLFVFLLTPICFPCFSRHISSFIIVSLHAYSIISMPHHNYGGSWILIYTTLIQFQRLQWIESERNVFNGGQVYILQKPASAILTSCRRGFSRDRNAIEGGGGYEFVTTTSKSVSRKPCLRSNTKGSLPFPMFSDKVVLTIR